MNVRDHAREQRFVNMHLRDGMTFEDIGRLEGLTRERVRQIVRRAGVTVAESREAMRRAAMVETVCEECGVPVERRDSQVGRAAYCSPICGNRSRGRQLRVWTEDSLTAHLRSLADRLGRTPSQHDVNRHSPPSHMSFVRRFGSLRNAQRAAGLTPNRRNAEGRSA